MRGPRQRTTIKYRRWGVLYKGGLYFVEEVQTKLRYSHLAFVALREVLDLEATAHVRRVLRVILQASSPADVERRLTDQIADHFATRHHSVHQWDGKRQRLAAKITQSFPLVSR